MNAASKVRKTPARQPALSLTRSPTLLLQRTLALTQVQACGGSPGLGGECEERRKINLQRTATHRDAPAEIPSIVNDVLSSTGQPLDAKTRGFMESRFGHNFSNVRMHTDARAAESAQAVNALAYTVGRNVVFGAGQYAPHSRVGQQLLAHELTHTIQQRNAGAPSEIELSRPSDPLEQQADVAARRVMRGNGTRVAPSHTLQLARQPAPPKDDPKKKPGEKKVTTQPPPQEIPASEVKKEDIKPAEPEKQEEKKGVELTATLGTETEIKRGEEGTKAEAADKFSLEVAIPITDKLQVGRLSFLKEASVEGSLGFPAAGLYPKTLSSLELQTSLKVLSLEFEKVKVPLGVADFGISGSVLGSAGYNVAEGTGEFKAGFAGEAEAKFKPAETSPFFITAKVGVEKTFDKEGNAEFKWSPVTWKTGVATGFEF